MNKQSIETAFINWIVSANTFLNKEKIKRKGPGENHPHVRFSYGCGINSVDEFVELFKPFGYTPVSNNEFSKKYQVGGYIKWHDQYVGVLYGVAPKGYSERKRWSPQNLGLDGFLTNNLKDFRKKIINGLIAINEPEIELFIKILDNIEFDIPFEETTFLKTNRGEITSGFGEVLAAYADVKKGFTINFNGTSNQKVIDYSVQINNVWKDVSVKNTKGGGKVNLSDFVNYIDLSTGDIHAKVLHAIGSHNRDLLFELVASVCPRIKKIKEIIGGLSVTERTIYVKTHTYDEFYNKIKNDKIFICKNEALGIPKEQDWKPNSLTPRSLWEQGSVDPIDFTINTLISRFWGESSLIGISKVVTKFLTEPKFKVVDIANGNVIITEKEFKDIRKWKTVYWGRATKAWHNWIAVQPAKEK